MSVDNPHSGGILRELRTDAALRELPHDFRMTILLADVEEMPLRDIAALCGCPIGTVASRLARGRALLRTRLLARRRTSGGEV